MFVLPGSGPVKTISQASPKKICGLDRPLLLIRKKFNRLKWTTESPGGLSASLFSLKPQSARLPKKINLQEFAAETCWHLYCKRCNCCDIAHLSFSAVTPLSKLALNYNKLCKLQVMQKKVLNSFLRESQFQTAIWGTAVEVAAWYWPILRKYYCLEYWHNRDLIKVLCSFESSCSTSCFRMSFKPVNVLNYPGVQMF